MRQDWKVVFQTSAHRALTAPLVVPVSSRWDLRMKVLCMNTPSSQFAVKKGEVKTTWDGERRMAEGQ